MPVDRGDYDASVEYAYLDMVHTSDSTYVSKVDGNIGNDVTDTEYWQCYANGKPATEAAARCAANEGSQAESTPGDGTRWGSYKAAEADRGTAAQAAEGTSGSTAGDGSRWGAYKTAEAARNTARETAEGSVSSQAGDGTRWGAYKSAEASRDTASGVAEGTKAGSVAGDGSRWGDYKSAEQNRDSEYNSAESGRDSDYAAAEGSAAGSSAGDGTRWGAYKAAEAARQEEMDHKANIDGDYALLNAGTSDNFRGQEPNSDEYTLRMTGWNGEGAPTEVANGVAPVTKIEGNAAAVNQLVQNGNFSDGATGWSCPTGRSISVTDKIATIVIESLPTSSVGVSSPLASVKHVVGHKYLIVVSARNISCTTPRISPTLSASSSTGASFVGISNSWATYYFFVSPTVSSEDNLSIALRTHDASGNAGGSMEVKDIYCHDLTLIFGPGNEPTTVAQFEKWLEDNGLLAPYIPNMLTLLGAKMTGAWSLPSVNLLDPTTKTARLKAYVNSTTGTGFANNQYTVKNLPTGATLSFTPDSTGVAETLTPDANDRITISGTGMLTVVTNDSVAGSFVCATWDGTKDDAPDEYQKDAKPFDLSKVYGILDGESALSQVFPDGVMRKADYAGTVRDWIDLAKAEAVVKVGDQDMGAQDLSYMKYDETQGPLFRVNLSARKNGNISDVVGALCAKYAITSTVNRTNKTVSGSSTNVDFIDDDYNDAAAFKTAMSGVHLWFELATPLHYTGLVYRDNGVDTPISELKFLVNNWSTQGVDIPAFVDGAPVAVTPRITQIFGPDYREMVDTLSDMMTEMYNVADVKANLQGLLEAFKTANIISAYTLTDPAAGGKTFGYEVTKYTE